MDCHVYRFDFADSVSIQEVEDTLELALLGAQSLHGEARVRLDVRHTLDADRRAIVIDAGTPAGQSVNELFTGYVRREFGEGSFTVRRIAQTFSDAVAPAA